VELRQLKSLVMLVELDFSVSRAASRLNLVQPAVSQHLKHLEEELGTKVFQRQGKRLVGLTEAGEQVLHYARATLAGAANVLAVGRDHVEEDSGVLRIGATHTQARYVLPPVIRSFREAYPSVEVQIHQANPIQLVDMAVNDAVDLAICTEALDSHPALKTIPSHRWNRCLIALPGHPALEARPITLDTLCEYPLVTYVFGFTGRGHLSDAFAREGMRPHVVLSATDTDVIKTYVREGFGIGIIADLAYQDDQDSDLGLRDLSHLFSAEVTKIAYAKDKYLRRFQERFIDLFQKETIGIVRGKRTR
jgi:LysR family cys regulon transcriptional activator